jgi:hypothetical protein
VEAPQLVAECENLALVVHSETDGRSTSGESEATETVVQPAKSWPELRQVCSEPELWIFVGLILGIVALFLPWWGISGPSGFEYGLSTGFSGWGIAYFVCWLVVMTFLFVRTIGRDAVKAFELPFAEWLVYAFGGVFMFMSALIVWATIPSQSPLGLDSSLLNATPGYSIGVRFGWWLAVFSKGPKNPGYNSPCGTGLHGKSSRIASRTRASWFQSWRRCASSQLVS